jgi:hypothetical protein
VQYIGMMPRQQIRVSVTEPLSRGVLQRGGYTTDMTNASELRAVIARRQDPPTAYGVQDNIPARMFPQTYVFTPHNRPAFVNGPQPGLGGIRIIQKRSR